MGHDHITHIEVSWSVSSIICLYNHFILTFLVLTFLGVQKLTADGSVADRKCCQEPGCDEIVSGRVMYCNSHTRGHSSQQLGYLQSSQKTSDLYMPPVKGRQCTEPSASAEQDVSIKYEGNDQGKLNDRSGNTEGNTEQLVLGGPDTLCKHDNCKKQAQSNALYCKLHSGGSKGCLVRDCVKAAHGGTPLCIGHGGGKRCIVAGCPNAACGQGRSEHCVRHGGGKRCKFEGCVKGAQGNTDFCIRHGGGRRCKSEGCTKSAQGRTDFCIKHGGGSRCQFQGCNSSAKWGTDHCSVHRKSLLGETPEALPLPSAKRRGAKKPKKEVKPPLLASQLTVTTAASTAGSSTPQAKGILHMPSNRELSHKIVMAAGQAAMAPAQVLPLSMKPPALSMKPPAPSPSGTEKEAPTSSTTLNL
ncbi:probable WRKY transcription factor 19 isoform X1 [Triticum aestivum]|uniref:probable WRKY transcription factor 19 isoform X1 n=1 Tax=Triticum aestivum TaxID=4565 RepID=UPI001D00B281|nr:probable WRKY transcription factor 19 isoform X1 [Triticum aestivum]